MTPETIATLIAALGAIIAALYGIHRSSREGAGAMRAPNAPAPSTPNDVARMMALYLDRLSEIERAAISAANTLHDIRRTLDGTGIRQEKMVDELESISRTMTRIENAQGACSQAVASMRHYEETQVQILAQIREEIKALRSAETPFNQRREPHPRGR